MREKIDEISSINAIITELHEHEKRLDDVRKKKISLENLPESADKNIAEAMNLKNLKLTSVQAEMAMAKNI